MAEQKLDTEIRREQIAQAALELVAAQGLRRLNVAAVARRVGIVPSGIYRHFKSKDEILDAVLRLLEDRLQGIIQAATEKHADPLERLKAVLTHHVRFIREGRAFPRIIFSDEVHDGRADRKQQVLGILTGYLREIGRIVEQGQQQGQIRAELNPETICMLFMGIVVPAGIRWHLTDGGFDVTRHAHRAWQMLRSAIVPPAARPEPPSM